MKKILLTILAVLAMSGMAVAQTETLLTTITATAKEQASYSTANVATVSFSNLPSTATATYGSDYLANWGWYGYGFTATVTPAEGYTITKCIFYDDANRTATDSEVPFVVETTEEDKTPRINGTPIDGGNMWSKGIKKIEVYGYVAQTAPSDINLHRNDDGTWGFIMPGRNLVMSTESFSSNDPNGYTLAGVPEGWLVIAAGDTVTITDGVTTPITEGAPVTIVPTGNLRRIKSITLVDELPPVAAPTLTLGEMTQGGDPLNNGSGSETYFSPTFSEGQRIALVHGGVKDVVTVGTPNPDGSAPITGGITVGADNEDIVLVYPADLVAVAAGGTAYTENTDVTNKFKTQDGTLAYIRNNLDIRQGTGKLAVSGASASLKANVSMASQIAIWKLTMTGGNGMIMAQKVTVKVGGNKVAEASTSGVYFAYPIDIYLALNPATMGTGTLRIEADEFGTIYYYQKDGGVSLTAGKFYQSAVELER